MLLGSPFPALGLRNRVISPPMERNYGTPDGRVTDMYVAYLRERAAGGTALVFTEATYVRADGRGRRLQLGAHGDHVMPGLAALASAVHGCGGLLGVELNHAGRVASPSVSGLQPVAPSAVPFRGVAPRALSTGEVAALVDSFAEAARRCAEAGVDVLSVHAAHGYLIHQFLSPRTNHRTDRYGDPPAFVSEVLEAVRAAGRPVFLRLSAFEGVPDGLSLDDTLELTARLPLDCVDVLDISAGCYEAGEWMVQPGEVVRGVLAPYARKFRSLGKPVCVAGRIPTAEVAEQILRSGAADLVAVGRAQHADPHWTRKALTGAAPRPCIACNQGCIDELHTQHPIWCLVNPDPPPVTAGGPAQRVLVVGGGVAGLEAAHRAASAGHKVVLFEAAPTLGGRFHYAATLPSRPEFARLLDWYRAELTRLGAEVHLSTPAGAATVAAWRPDIVVMACGGTPFVPPIPGASLPRVIDLVSCTDATPGTVVTVWGADRAGLAVADAAAGAGHRVLILAAGDALAPEAGFREKVLVERRLRASANVEIRLGTTLETVTEDTLLVGAAGRLERLDIRGPVVASHGTLPRTVDLGDGPWRTVVVGEAGTATSAAEAIRQAAALTFA
ncbi:oxidoreductase [Paractinoplanes atraurantiacus]|uniref:2,4-dienoyl-CoA reductase n=1 Tax=Paractinoplanes atraurantiacus TaxID=1036182 RepID=A0A285K7S5_9ACTN|nr:FAD-dependent oxidoreductase [Actinoplanes atraurantiacus]SNY68625.1 2,4-dienoyl-CoA reductase [Actinoplanes atraurantiacus]